MGVVTPTTLRGRWASTLCIWGTTIVSLALMGAVLRLAGHIIASTWPEFVAKVIFTELAALVAGHAIASGWSWLRNTSGKLASLATSTTRR